MQATCNPFLEKNLQALETYAMPIGGVWAWLSAELEPLIFQ